MNSGQAYQPCRGSCSPIPGRGCFCDLPGTDSSYPRPPQSLNNSGTGTGTEARTVAEMGTGTTITGTGIGLGRAEGRRKSARNRKIAVDAVRETGETWVESEKM